MDLGFPPKEAKRLLAHADAQIDESIRLKRQLMNEIAEWMKAEHRGRFPMQRGASPIALLSSWVAMEPFVWNVFQDQRPRGRDQPWFFRTNRGIP